MTGKPIYDVLMVLAAIIAVLFTLLIFFTSKGDAMSSGGSVRTSFKGSATFDDKVSKLTLYMAGAFVSLMIILDFVAPRQ